MYKVILDPMVMWGEIKGFYHRSWRHGNQVFRCSRSKKDRCVDFEDQIGASRFALLYGQSRVLIQTRPISMHEFDDLVDWMDRNIGQQDRDWSIYDGIHGLLHHPSPLIMAIGNNKRAAAFRLVWG